MENLALRHQIGVLRRSASKRPRLNQSDRFLFAVTAHATAEWTAQQLREVFPWESAPRYLLRDRDRIFGQDFVQQVKAMGIQQVLSAPRSPWQRAYVERVIGTIRRECLDHMIVLNEGRLYSISKLSAAIIIGAERT